MSLLRLFAPMPSDGRLLIRTPIIRSDDSEPEPDLAVVVPGAPLGKPTLDQVALAIEVADRSRRLDLDALVAAARP